MLFGKLEKKEKLLLILRVIFRVILRVIKDIRDIGVIVDDPNDLKNDPNDLKNDPNDP